MGEKIRLNIGAGDTQIPGFISLDIKTGTDASGKLNYPDNSVDDIYASHVLEHIHHSKTFATLAEWVRVLKPGGRIRIAVPDSAKIIAKAGSGEMSMSMFSAWAHGSHDVDTDRHQAEFDFENLSAMLRRLGIDRIGDWSSEYDDCSRLPLSLNVGGYKRQTLINPNPKVVMVLSTSRFGPTDFYHGVCECCRKFGWELIQWGGDNWAKALTQVIRQALDRGADYVLTLDFDSGLDADETHRLIDFMQEHPEVAAVWPVQAHRSADLPLGYNPKCPHMYDFSKSNQWNGEFTPYGSGHFGCTVIRRQVFETIQRPWFKGLPSTKFDHGAQEITSIDWDNDSLDNDISFWIACSAHGFLFGQANSVQILHFELAAKYIDGNEVKWMPIQSLRKNGRPRMEFDGEAWNHMSAKRLGLVNDPAVDSPKTESSTITKPEPEVLSSDISCDIPNPSGPTESSADLMAECDRLHTNSKV